MNGPDANESPLPLASAFTEWVTATSLEQIVGTHPELNTSALEGCPFMSPDGSTLFMASNRPGGLGGIDIWVSTRASTSAPWDFWSESVAAANWAWSASSETC